MEINLEKIDTFTGHKDCVYALSEGQLANTFYSASGDGMIVEWNTIKSDLGKPIAKIDNSIYAMHLLPAKNHLWIANNTEGLHLIDTIEKKEILNVKLGKVSIFDINATDHNLIVGDNIGFIHILDLETNKFIKHIEAAQKSARSIAINTKRNEMAVGCSDWKIRIYDLNTFELKKTLESHKNSVFSVKYFSDENLMISGGRDAHLKVWNENYELIEDIPAHLFAINDIIYLNDHQLIASCSMDKSIKIWDSQNFKLLKVIDKAKHASHGTSVNKLLWKPESQVLLSASDDRTISMWKLF